MRGRRRDALPFNLKIDRKKRKVHIGERCKARIREPGAKQDPSCWVGKEEMNSRDFLPGENSTRRLAVDYVKEIMWWLFRIRIISMSKLEEG